MSELRSNTEWRQWGKYDPLWAVAAWNDKQKTGATPWTEEEFYALGQSDWQDFSHQWHHYGFDKKSCLEIGCGAGRLTRQLAQTFDRVHAVDVSEDMIIRAKQNIRSTNVEFSVIDGIHLPLPDNSVKAVFSTHVIQHLDSVPIGLSYFREFYRVLEPGGTIMVHLPVYEFPGKGTEAEALFKAIWALHRGLGYARAELKRRLGMRTMRGTPFPIGPLNMFLSKLGFKNVEFRIFPTKINLDPHPFVFATK
jgi:ubiquinone/menaquinone biosynthesis C-methylase UbiE